MLSKNPDYHYNANNLFTVWDMTPANNGHEAPFPLDLPTKCVLASSDVGDWVLDPFAGSGTTAVACELLERNSTMVELYPESCAKIDARLKEIPSTDRLEWV
jgi:site-specific DNA-methyltransferase (adenine-specific)